MTSSDAETDLEPIIIIIIIIIIITLCTALSITLLFVRINLYFEVLYALI